MSVRKELYKIVHGTKTWYFTNVAKQVVHEGITYLPIKGLQRTEILDESIDKCDTDVSFPHPMPLLNAQGDDLVAVFDRKIFYGDVALTILELKDNETLVLFLGRVGIPSFNHKDHVFTLPCYTGERDLNREICTPVYQSPCPHKLYGRMCGLKFEDWSMSVRVLSVSGSNITFELLGDPVAVGYLTGGLLLKDGVFTSISEHLSVSSAKLYAPHAGLKANDIVSFAPGCDQTLTMCYERFDNNLRHGGCPNVPNVNPVGRSIM